MYPLGNTGYIILHIYDVAGIVDSHSGAVTSDLWSYENIRQERKREKDLFQGRDDSMIDQVPQRTPFLRVEQVLDNITVVQVLSAGLGEDIPLCRS